VIANRPEGLMQNAEEEEKKIVERGYCLRFTTNISMLSGSPS
jgi:hypothetical protein